MEETGQEGRRLEEAVDLIIKRQDKTDEILAEMREMLSNLGGNYKKQPQNRNQEREETNLEWSCQKERNRIKDDLDEFLEGFGPEISPLYMLQKAVQNGLIQSFKPTSTQDSYEKTGKGICDTCDEYADSKHSHKGYSLLILHPDMEDELMAFVFHKVRKEDVQEESIKSEDQGKEVRERCKVQLTDEEEPLKSQEDTKNMKERIKNMLQDYEKPVPCIEKTICEDYGMNEEIVGKTNLKCKEEVRGICEEELTIHEEKFQVEGPNVVKKDKRVQKLGKKHKANVKYKKKDKRNLEKNKVKRKEVTLWRHNKERRVKRRKAQEGRSKKRERVQEMHDSGAESGPARQYRKKTHTAVKGPAAGKNVEWKVRKKLGFMEKKEGSRKERETEATWEDATKFLATFPDAHLEDKVLKLAGSIVTPSVPPVLKTYFRKNKKDGGNK